MKLKTIFVSALMMVGMTQIAFADWQNAGTLDRPIRLQDLKNCSFRLAYSWNDGQGGTWTNYFGHWDGIENRSPANGSVRYQSLRFPLNHAKVSALAQVILPNPQHGGGSAFDSYHADYINPANNITDTFIEIVTTPSFSTQFMYTYVNAETPTGSFIGQPYDLHGAAFRLEKDCSTVVRSIRSLDALQSN